MKRFNLRKQLLVLLPISESQLNTLILRSPYIYKKYTIPKKSGGVRNIAQPARATKYLQQLLIELVFNELPIHDNVTAYVKGASIKNNAQRHAENCYLSKFDFKDFFTSIKDSDIRSHLIKHGSYKYTDDELNDISRIVCIKTQGRDSYNLSIGAPSSPLISNTILYDFDTLVSEWCNDQGVTYSRYADDLAFSTNHKNTSHTIEPFIRDVVRKLEYPKLRFNNKKTIHLSKKHQRRITGLIVTNEGNISLGRSKKRLISSMIHKFSLGQLAEPEIARLQGFLGLAKDIEPSFINKMKIKYGDDNLTKVIKFRKE